MKSKELIEPAYRKIFTDREEERKVFFDTLEKNEKNVINYHGMGGIGKT